MTTTPQNLTALLPLAAEIDAVFTPVRRQHSDGGHRALELEMEFRESGGLPYSGGGSAGDRKSREREVDALEAAGLVKCVRHRGRRTHWRLSDAADWTLRWYVGGWLYPMQALQVGLLCIQANTAAGHVHDRGFVPEVFLIGLADWKPGMLDGRLYDLESLLLPGLVRGLVVSGADGYGRCGYSLTDAGRKWITTPTAPPDAADVPTYSSEASNEHFRLFMAAIKRLDSEKPRLNAIYICLSAGLWPENKPVGPGIFTQAGKVRSMGDFRRRSRPGRRRAKGATRT